MSLELKIESLTNAIGALVAALGQRYPVEVSAVADVVIPPASGSTPAATPTVVVTAPVPVPPPAPVMPPPPTFVAPPPVTIAAPVAPAVPFSDSKGLIDYVMARYKALGPEKGGKIHGVLLSMGCNAINEVKPEQYGQFFTAVEAIQ